MPTLLQRWRKQGWKPKRTIEFASWDGHELGLFGSAAYIYENGPALRKNVFQYINTDQLTTDDPFVVSASPGLYAFMKQICDVVPAADGNGMLGQRDQRRIRCSIRSPAARIIKTSRTCSAC